MNDFKYIDELRSTRFKDQVYREAEKSAVEHGTSLEAIVVELKRKGQDFPPNIRSAIKEVYRKFHWYGKGIEIKKILLDYEQV